MIQYLDFLTIRCDFERFGTLLAIKNSKKITKLLIFNCHAGLDPWFDRLTTLSGSVY